MSDSWSGKAKDPFPSHKDGQKLENDTDELTKRLDSLDLIDNDKSENAGESSQPDIIQNCFMSEQRTPPTPGFNMLKNRELFVALTLAVVCMIVGSFGLTIFQAT